MRGIKVITSSLTATFLGLVAVFFLILQLISVPVLALGVQHNVLAPGTFSVVADANTYLNGGNFHFDGYNNAQLRMRFNNTIDLTKYTNLKAVVKFTSTNQVASGQVILRFYDSTWSGRSNYLYLPVTLNSAEKNITIPLSVFSNSNFNSKSVKDLVFSVSLKGKFTADLNFSSFTFEGTENSVPPTTTNPPTTPTTSTPPSTTTPTTTPPITTPTPTVVCPSPTSGSFVGCYYSDQFFGTLKVARTDSAINFNWGLGSPDPLIPADHFSVKWKGYHNFEAGDYIFSATVDDGIRLYVDGNLIIDKYFGQPPTTYSATKNLTAGNHLIAADYFEDGQGASVKVSWVKVNNSIPTPTPTPTPTTTTTTTIPSTPPAGTNASVISQTSSKVSINWNSVPNTSKVNIYLAAEPKDPANSGANMPGEILLGSVAGGNSYTLNNLAPATDNFIRVEMVTSAGNVNTYLHTKTLGGPSVKLDSSVREVHAYAPNILQVVVADGTGWVGKDAGGYDVFDLPKNIGASLQSGTWTITRANGTTIPVTTKYRHSVPVSADDYRDMGKYNDGRGNYTNFFEIQSDKVTAIDHRIYLVLNQNIGSREILKITGPNGISFTLPFSDKYLETPVIQLNQVGYNPAATERYAYVSGWLGDGGVLNLNNFSATAEVLKENSNETMPRTVAVNNLPIISRGSNDKDLPGVEVRQINLATVQPSESNYYRVRIPGVGVSWQTEVSNRAAFRTFYVINRGLFFQRWGADLKSNYTTWSRPQDHTGDVYTANLLEFANGGDTYYSANTPKVGPLKVVGGYRDAGDFDQRPMHTAVTQLLLRAFELNPTKYTDNQLNIPESGNGIPDMLDQALWGIKGWMALQDLTDGGVRMGIQSDSHPRGYYLVNQDSSSWWTFGKEAKTSARVAGLFAQASRLVAPYNATLASDLKIRAVKAYGYANNNYNLSVASSLLYGSGELYKLTNEVQYKNKFDSLWSQIDSKVKSMYGNVVWNTPFELVAWNLISQQAYKSGDYFTPDFFTAYYNTTGADTGIKQLMTTKMTAEVNGLLNDIQNNHVHRNARPQNYPLDWGGGTAVTKYLDPVLSYMQMTGNQTQTQINALSLSMDYILGGNPAGVTYVTGLGTRRPEEPLHTDSLAFLRLGNINGVKAAMPGIPSYGAINGPGGALYYQPSLNAFYPAYSTQPQGLRFTDTRPFVMSSEFDVWQVQAPLVEAASILVGNNISPTVLNGTDDCGIDHCMDLARYK